jgi:alanyl-tRNA synthetase
MLDNWIDKRLEKQGFIRVPKSWTEDYRQLTEKNDAINRLFRELGREYNNTLRELAEAKGSKYIKEALAEIDIDTTGIKKEDLIELYVNTFAVTFEDDYDMEVK